LEKNSANFDEAQGGIFEARFDNELARGSSTLGAEVAAMIKGLKTGNAALVAAAAEEMHANAADVGGNNLSVGGTPYNTDGLTPAEVLGAAAADPVAPAAAPTAHGTNSSTTGEPLGAPGPTHDFTHPHHHNDHPHFGHLWG
jgi:hypothetical protein